MNLQIKVNISVLFCYNKRIKPPVPYNVWCTPEKKMENILDGNYKDKTSLF